MISNTKINLSLSIRDTEHLKEVLDMLTSYGVPTGNIQAKPEKETLTVRTEPKAITVPHVVEKGPKEKEFLERTGQLRMNIPVEWTGTREDLAAHRIAQMDAAKTKLAAPVEKLPEDNGKKFDWED